MYKPRVAYLCDRFACPKCSYPQCKHTTDVAHAINFSKASHDKYFEDEPFGLDWEVNMIYESDGVRFECDVDIDEEEARAYILRALKMYKGKQIKTIRAHVDGDYIDLEYEVAKVPFSRIRRITGYLVGTMDRWNDAKTAEEHDRVKHSVPHIYGSGE